MTEQVTKSKRKGKAATLYNVAQTYPIEAGGAMVTDHSVRTKTEVSKLVSGLANNPNFRITLEDGTIVIFEKQNNNNG